MRDLVLCQVHISVQSFLLFLCQMCTIQQLISSFSRFYCHHLELLKNIFNKYWLTLSYLSFQEEALLMYGGKGILFAKATAWLLGGAYKSPSCQRMGDGLIFLVGSTEVGKELQTCLKEPYIDI